MADNSEFWKQYKDPRWQEKRLRIMDRDSFGCTDCGDKESTLNVHHTYYEKGLKPWEYPDESLLTLCESCHEKAENVAIQIKRLFGNQRVYPEIILGFMRAMSKRPDDEVTLIDCENIEVLDGICAYFRVDYEDGLPLLENGKIDPYALTNLREYFVSRNSERGPAPHFSDIETAKRILETTKDHQEALRCLEIIQSRS